MVKLKILNNLIMVTKEQFLAYYKVQKWGGYNMLDPMAILISGLEKNVYLDIIKNYSEYYNKYIKEA